MSKVHFTALAFEYIKTKIIIPLVDKNNNVYVCTCYCKNSYKCKIIKYYTVFKDKLFTLK